MREIVAKLTPKQEKAIVALLTHPTVEAAAAVLNISPATIYRWLQDPAFDAAYRQARREAVRQAIARLQQVSGKAVDALLEVIDTEYTPAPPAVRVSAAKTILEFALKAIEIEDLQARLEALEARMGEHKP